jgi:hypothetical protein
VFAGIEDIVIGREDAMAEEVVFEVLPGFFGGIAFGRGGGDIDEGDVIGYAQRVRAMPCGAVGDHGGVDVRGQLSADFVEMQLHHGGIGAGQDEPDGRIPLRTESAENIGILVARVDGNGRARSLGGPTMGASALLTDARFVLAPQLDGLAGMRGGNFL